MNFVTENIVLIVIAFASGAMLLWPAIQRRTSGPSLDTLAATRLINDAHAVVLDIRESAEFAAGHLPNARNIPMGELAARAAELPAGKPVQGIGFQFQQVAKAEIAQSPATDFPGIQVIGARGREEVIG